MISIDIFERLLDEVAEELPEAFYKELNGGILLIEDAKIHPKARNDDLYILGEYHRHHILGKYISIYYGSFARMYANMEEERLKGRIREVLRHEFRHHMESRSGLRDLEIEDEIDLARYEAYVKRKEN